MQHECESYANQSSKHEGPNNPPKDLTNSAFTGPQTPLDEMDEHRRQKKDHGSIPGIKGTSADCLKILATLKQRFPHSPKELEHGNFWRRNGTGMREVRKPVATLVIAAKECIKWRKYRHLMI